MSFSERYGYKTARESVQIDSMDEPLRNGLWSLLKLHIWDTATDSTGMYGGYYISPDSNKNLYSLCVRLWLHYFKKPLDQLDHDWRKVLDQLRKYYFDAKWNEVYDFLGCTSGRPWCRW